MKGLFTLATNLQTTKLTRFSSVLGIDDGLHRNDISIISSNNDKTEQQSQQQIEKDKDQLYFVVHVGPPKTATTTIQEFLTEIQSPTVDKDGINGYKNNNNTKVSLLSLDNYVYFGKFMVDGEYNTKDPKFSIFQNFFYLLTRQRKKRKASSNVARKSSMGWKSFLDQLEPYNDMNIVISDEVFSLNARTSEKGDTTLDWYGLQKALLPKYKLVIVVAYRRYVDWVPSAKQQIERYKPTKPRLRKWPSDRGLVIQPLFPDYVMSEPFPYPSTYTVIKSLRLLRYNNASIPIKIFNLHEQHANITTLQTAFLCHTLPKTPNACKASQQFDIDNPKRLVANPEQPLTYDRLACAAEKAGLINNTKLVRRHQLALALQDFHTRLLQRNNNNNNNNNSSTATTIPSSSAIKKDLPLVCPTHDELERYLNISLEMESYLLPEFASSKHGSLQHKADFWNNAKKNKYCSVDVDAVMQHNETWRSAVLTYQQTRLIST